MPSPSAISPEVTRRVAKKLEDYLSAHRKLFPGRIVPQIPHIEFRDMTNTWGVFVSTPYPSIVLNSKLYFEHSWSSLMEVAEHELAHFLKFKLYPYVDEPPHGKMFRMICDMLGINPKASGDFPPLDEQLAMDDAQNAKAASPLELRIQKLLALSESPNEHEAHLALMKARELMEKHGIEVSKMANETDETPYVTTSVGCFQTHVPIDELCLMNILEEHYNIRYIIVPQTQPENGSQTSLDPTKKYFAFSVSGLLSDVKIALYVRDYILHFINDAWEKLPKAARANAGIRARRDFNCGVLDGMRQSLATNPQAQNDAALVLKKENIDSYWHRRFPQIKTTRRSNAATNQDLKNAGQQAGRKLHIHPGIDTQTPPHTQLRLK